jgi:hypothetical protein
MNVLLASLAQLAKCVLLRLKFGYDGRREMKQLEVVNLNLQARIPSTGCARVASELLC